MPVIPPNNTGLSGEYFVAAELYLRGWSVGMTIGNAKAVDLFAEKNKKILEIQVKSIYKKKNVGWPVMRNQLKNRYIYIFVNLNADIDQHPDFYICKANEARCRVKEYENRGIINLSSLNNKRFLNNWDKLEK